MKEPDREREIEIPAEEDEKIQSDDGGDSSSSSSQANAPSFLTELNLLVVLLSTFAPSDDDEENAEFEEKEKRSRTDNEAMVSAAKLRAKRREINAGKPVGRRRSQQLQTAPKDIRHGRRM